MPLDQTNQDWKDTLDEGRDFIMVKGARVSLIDETFWDVQDVTLPVGCGTVGNVDPKTAKSARLSKSGSKDYKCARTTRVCAGVDIETAEFGTQDNPLLHPPVSRIAGRSVMRRPLLPISAAGSRTGSAGRGGPDS